MVTMDHGAGEMHVEGERHGAGLAERTIVEADCGGVDELRGYSLMGVSRHIDILKIRVGAPGTQRSGTVLPHLDQVAIRVSDIGADPSLEGGGGSVSEHAPIYWDGGTRDVRRICRSNEGDHMSDLLRCC